MSHLKCDESGNIFHGNLLAILNARYYSSNKYSKIYKRNMMNN